MKVETRLKENEIVHHRYRQERDNKETGWYSFKKMKLLVFSTSDQRSHHDLTTQLVDYVAE